MKIEKLSDVIIPTIPITNEADWLEEIFPIIEGYAGFSGTYKVEPTAQKEIDKCENRLNIKLPDDLKLFYLKFGPAYLMEKLLPVGEFEYLKDSFDDEYLELYSKEEQKMISGLIVFGDYLGCGNLWCFHKDSKEIFYFNHDTRPNINGMF